MTQPVTSAVKDKFLKTNSLNLFLLESSVMVTHDESVVFGFEGQALFLL